MLSADVKMDEPLGPAVHSLTRYQMEPTVINDLQGDGSAGRPAAPKPSSAPVSGSRDDKGVKTSDAAQTLSRASRSAESDKCWRI